MSAVPPVMCIGTLAHDTIERPGQPLHRALGGSVVFSALASALFAPTRLRAVAGPDLTVEEIALLEGAGLDLGGLDRDPTAPTFRWGGRYGEDLNDRVTTELTLGCLENWYPVPTSGDHACVGGVLLGAISPRQQRAFLDSWPVGERPFFAADTFPHWITGDRASVESVYREMDCILVNREEAALFVGPGSIEALGAGLLKLFGAEKRVIVKDGSRGATLFFDSRIASVGVAPGIAVVDPTGAGDAFAGALLGRLAEVGCRDFDALVEAITWASATASFMVEALGAGAFPATRAPVAARQAQIVVSAQ